MIILETCPHIKLLLKWIQQDKDLQPNAKKLKLELAESDVDKSPLKETNERIILKKVKKELTLDPDMLEIATRLSIKRLMEQFQGKTVDEFKVFCEQEMLKENCNAAQIITIEQADTNIWHDLRIGRITASRLHEVTRCTMKNGSLVDKIMGKRSGTSYFRVIE